MGERARNCTRGVDRWPCTGDRVQEGRGEALRGAIFFQDNEHKGAVDGGLGSCQPKRFNLRGNKLTQREEGADVLSTTTTESRCVLSSVYVPIKQDHRFDSYTSRKINFLVQRDYLHGG